MSFMRNEFGSPSWRRYIHALKRVTLTCLALGSVTAAVGCGGPSSESEELDSVSQHINPPQGWRIWSQLPNNPTTPPTVQTFADSPGVCLATRDGIVVVGRDLATNRIRTLVNQWRLWGSPPWADFGSFTFVSKPACSALDEVAFTPPPVNNQFIVLARSGDNKFYARTGLVDTTIGNWPNDPPSQPTVKVHTHKISDDLYASAPGVTVSSGKVLVVGRRSNNRIYLHQNALTGNTTNPFASANWQAAVIAPNLPSPWVAQGDPVIGNTKPFIGVVTVFTRARNIFTNAMRVYYTYWSGTAFSEVSPGVNWDFVPTGGVTVVSDPSVEVDTTEQLATLYFRSTDNRIYQSSGIANLWGAFTVVRPDEDDTFTGAPSAVGNGNFEGRHLVVAKKTNNQFYFSSPPPF